MATLTQNSLLKTIFAKQLEAVNMDESDFRPTNWIIKELGIKSGGTYLLHAYSNVGKSYMSINLALCIANDIPFLGCVEIQNPGKVLYLNYEMNQEAMVNYYFSRLAKGLDFEPREKLNVSLISYPEIYLDDKENAEVVLTELIKVGDFKCVFIDCLGASISNTDLNSDDARRSIDTLNRVAQNTDCAIIVLHHEAKAASNNTSTIKAAKGNNSIMNACDGSIRLTKEDKSQVVSIELGKLRYFAQNSKEKLQYVLEDCKGKSAKLGSSAGLKLTRVSSEIENKINKENEEKIQILKVLNENTNVNQATLITFMSGNNVCRNKTLELLKKCQEEELVFVKKGLKNACYYILSHSGLSKLEEYNQACKVEKQEEDKIISTVEKIFEV